MTSKKKKVLTIIINIFLIIAILISLSLLIFNLTHVSIVVSGNSMNPLLDDMDMGYMNRVNKNTKLERFDVVGIKVADDDNWIKRVVGLPNETIRFEEDKLLINGVEIEQPFEYTHTTRTYASPYNLGDNQYLVVGDNRAITVDPIIITIDQVLGRNGFINRSCVSFNYGKNSCSISTSNSWKWIK